MSSLDREVTGKTLRFTLADEIEIVRAQLAAGADRTARTLVKDGVLRATLVGLNPGGVLKSHQADGPITVHVLDGALEFEADGRTAMLPAGALFALEAGVPHQVTAPGGGIFLLTVAAGK